MSFNPREYLLPAATQFRRHPDSVAERVFEQSLSRLRHRDWPRSGTPGTSFQAFTPHQPVAIRHCPIDPYWRDWDMFSVEYLFGRIPPDDFAVCARANRAQPRAHRCRVPLVWEFCQVAPPPPRPLPSSQRGPIVPSRERHMHAEALIDRRLVHVDFVSLTKYSPGRAIEECRIFIDGRLAGRGGGCSSSIGVGGYCLPAVALVGAGLAITADVMSDEHGPVVELWDVDDDATYAAEGDTRQGEDQDG